MTLASRLMKSGRDSASVLPPSRLRQKKLLVKRRLSKKQLLVLLSNSPKLIKLLRLSRLTSLLHLSQLPHPRRHLPLNLSMFHLHPNQLLHLHPVQR